MGRCSSLRIRELNRRTFRGETCRLIWLQAGIQLEDASNISSDKVPIEDGLKYIAQSKEKKGQGMILLAAVLNMVRAYNALFNVHQFRICAKSPKSLT